MSVVFTTIDSITIDGIPAGNIVDVISNHAPKRAEVLAAYQVFVDAQKAELEEANATIATLQAKVADLEQYRPFNPRILKGEAFYNRVSKEDMVTLLASDDATLVTVGKTIEAYRAHHWPVVLDSQDFQDLVGYVLQSGVFDGDEVNAIMRDATREEAYGVEG
jgi:hypothetical protein